MYPSCKICGERIWKTRHSKGWYHYNASPDRTYDHEAVLLKVREGPHHADKGKRV